MFYCLNTKSEKDAVKYVIRLCEFVLFSILVIFRIVQLNFRWYMIFIILLVQVIIGIFYLVKKTKSNKPFEKKHVVVSSINYYILLIIAIIPAIVFPQFKDLEPTGNYTVAIQSYTITDTNRIE